MQAEACEARFFSKSEVASIHMHEQTRAFSLAMQPMYSESVTFAANYCRNTRNICVTNIWRRNMSRAVFEIPGHIPLLNLLPDLKEKVTVH